MKRNRRLSRRRKNTRIIRRKTRNKSFRRKTRNKSFRRKTRNKSFRRKTRKRQKKGGALNLFSQCKCNKGKSGCTSESHNDDALEERTKWRDEHGSFDDRLRVRNEIKAKEKEIKSVRERLGEIAQIYWEGDHELAGKNSHEYKKIEEEELNPKLTELDNLTDKLSEIVKKIRLHQRYTI